MTLQTPRESLLEEFVRIYPFQPATAYWRAVEIAHVLSYPFPEGLGLDLGCGDGKLTRVVAERGGRRDWVGMDLDAYETRMAEASGLYRQVHVASAAAIPEPEGKFDFVFSNSVLEHIDAIEGTIREVGRVLKPGGAFLFTVPADRFHDCLRGSARPWISRERYLQTLDRQLAHLRYWSVEDWKRELGRAGLTVERATRFLSAAQIRRWESLVRVTGGLLYKVFGERKRPIEIQKTLRLRKQSVKLPKPVRGAIAATVALGVGTEPVEVPGDEPCGCLMILARKA
ncbi:MAG: class I SAM-dependent methyltransferase [Oligoflexia bacterium]|nr:class I SAM-dependent methyltransferase [Oligoflexia bacterium]